MSGIELSFIQKILAFTNKTECTEFIDKIDGKLSEDGTKLD
jgi:hypothetical protein